MQTEDVSEHKLKPKVNITFMVSAYIFVFSGLFFVYYLFSREIGKGLVHTK
jgi:hypothetical protein